MGALSNKAQHMLVWASSMTAYADSDFESKCGIPLRVQPLFQASKSQEDPSATWAVQHCRWAAQLKAVYNLLVLF